MRIRVHGGKPRNRAFRRKTAAKAWAADVESCMGRGAFVPPAVDRRRTLADVIDAYLSDELPTKAHNKDARSVIRYLAWWRDNAGYITLDELMRACVFRSN